MERTLAAWAMATTLGIPISAETPIRLSPPGYDAYSTLKSVNGRALLGMRDANGVQSMWASDGTVEGMDLLFEAGFLGPVVVLNGFVYFRRANGIWRTDGSPSGTGLFVANGVGQFMAGAGGRLWFQGAGSALYVADVATGQVSFVTTPELMQNLVAVDGLAIYSAKGSDGQPWIWRTDGTTSGTYTLARDGAGWVSFGPYAPQKVGNAVYFAGVPAVGGEADGGGEPWRTEGTPETTFEIADLVPGTAGSGAFQFIPGLGRVLFSGDRLAPGLWTTDGTSDGTLLVSSLPSRIGSMSGAGRLAYFTLSGGCGGQPALWRSDGTSEGTFLLRDCLGPQATSFAPGMEGDAAGRLVFKACDAATGCELWVTDGTLEGTRLLVDAIPGPTSSNAGGSWANGKVFYASEGAWWSVSLEAPPVLDFDRNGYADLCWQGADGRLSVWYMRGTYALGRAFTEPDLPPAGGRLAGCGDLDGDGAADMLFRDTASGAVEVWRMQASRRLETRALPYRADAARELVAVADLDQDGHNDLVWHDARDGRLQVWLMNGLERRTLTKPAPAGVDDTAWRPVGAGNFDADGKADLLWRHEGSGRLVVWLMDGLVRRTGLFLTPAQAASLDWRVQSVVDLDSDGKADIVWRHRVAGRLVAWSMDGTVRLEGYFLSPSVAP